jgi:hypothetical protein
MLRILLVNSLNKDNKPEMETSDERGIVRSMRLVFVYCGVMERCCVNQ